MKKIACACVCVCVCVWGGGGGGGGGWYSDSMDEIYHMAIHLILNHLADGFNTLRPRQNGCHFPDPIFKGIYLNNNI